MSFPYLFCLSKLTWMTFENKKGIKTLKLLADLLLLSATLLVPVQTI